MVDDDGVSMSGDKAVETVELAVVCGEGWRLVVVGYDVEGWGWAGGALGRGHSGWRRGLEGLS